VRCTVPGHAPAQGDGRSRRSAEQKAARRLLAALTAENDDG
jgi:dsRNA-specific ribonuclease